MKNVRFILLAVVSLILIQACSKEGPAGPAGPAGSQGPQGAPGPQGNTGTANVVYSPWFNPITWTNNGTSSIYSNKAATGITQAVIDQGVVLAYVKFADEGGLVRALPAVTFSGKVIWSYSLTVGNIRFHGNPTDGISNLSAGFNMQFRYVIIPGAVAGGRLSSKPYTLKELQDMTYEQVMALFNIPENSSNTK